MVAGLGRPAATHSIRGARRRCRASPCLEVRTPPMAERDGSGVDACKAIAIISCFGTPISTCVAPIRALPCDAAYLNANHHRYSVPVHSRQLIVRCNRCAIASTVKLVRGVLAERDLEDASDTHVLERANAYNLFSDRRRSCCARSINLGGLSSAPGSSRRHVVVADEPDSENPRMASLLRSRPCPVPPSCARCWERALRSPAGLSPLRALRRSGCHRSSRPASLLRSPPQLPA